VLHRGGSGELRRLVVDVGAVAVLVVLFTQHLNNIGVGSALVWLVVLCVLEQYLVHVRAGVLEELV